VVSCDIHALHRMDPSTSGPKTVFRRRWELVQMRCGEQLLRSPSHVLADAPTHQLKRGMHGRSRST
jgi:hypothetical protein